MIRTGNWRALRFEDRKLKRDAKGLWKVRQRELRGERTLSQRSASKFATSRPSRFCCAGFAVFITCARKGRRDRQKGGREQAVRGEERDSMLGKVSVHLVQCPYRPSISPCGTSCTARSS
eukprot:302267-Rhodomonas_salina.1